MTVEVLDAAGNPQRTQTLGYDELDAAQDVVSGSYAIRRTPGGREVESDRWSWGVSVYTVLQRTGVTAAVSYVEVVDPSNGYVVNLDATTGDLAQAGSPGSPFQGSDTPVLTTAGGDAVGFIRPLRAGDDQDVNALDNFQSGSGGTIRMVVHTSDRPALRPVVTADQASVKYGKPITFSVAYSDGRRPRSPATYAWSFGDGPVPETCPAGSTESAPQHVYEEAGAYTVHVTVCGADGAQGRSADVSVTVGKKPPPPEDPGPPGGPGDGPTDGPTIGTEDGKGPNANGAPKGGGAGQGTGTGDSDGDTTGDGKQSDDKTGKPGEAASGDVRVDGVLLDARSATAVSVPAAPSAPTAAAAPRRATEIPTDWRWLLALLPVALLAAGAARQTPWLARRLPELPWRQT